MAGRFRKEDEKSRNESAADDSGGSGSTAVLVDAFIKVQMQFLEMTGIALQWKKDYIALLEDHNRLVGECLKLRLLLKQKYQVSQN